MGIHVIHHRTPPAQPINTSGDYCRTGCWAAPGREHGLACPEVARRDALRLPLVHLLRLALASDAILLALLIWSLR